MDIKFPKEENPFPKTMAVAVFFCNRGVSDRYVSGQCPGSIVWNRRFHH